MRNTSTNYISAKVYIFVISCVRNPISRKKQNFNDKAWIKTRMPFSGVRLQEWLLGIAFRSQGKRREAEGGKGGGGRPEGRRSIADLPMKACLQMPSSSSPEWMRCSSIALRFSVDWFAFSCYWLGVYVYFYFLYLFYIYSNFTSYSESLGKFGLLSLSLLVF